MSTEQGERRELGYDSLYDFLQEAEAFAESNNYRTIGNWSLAQILWHLNGSMIASLDGYSFQAPWYQRILGKLFKKKFLNMKIPAGFKLPPQGASLIPPDDVTIEEGLQLARTAVERLENESPNKPHPFFGHMEPEEWYHLHRGHAAMHMSFVLPIPHDS